MYVDYRNLPDETKELKEAISVFPMPLKFKTRLFGALMRADIMSLDKLKECTAEDLLRVRNIGPQTIDILLEYDMIKETV